MQFARPEAEKSQCSTCRFREPDYSQKRADGSLFVITGWDKCFCEKYMDKPVGIVFGDVRFKQFEVG